MIETFKAHRLFFILFFIYLIAGAVIIWIFPKGRIEIYINSFHHPILDQLFRGITFLGDGLFSVMIILYLFYTNIYHGILAAACIVSNAIFTQVLKRLIFEDAVRPIRFFEKNLDLYYIKGLEIYSNFSFPSGHTSGAFCLFFLLVLLGRKGKLDVVFFFLALAVAFSRMYLLQHFFIDTYFGAFIGTTITLLVFTYFHYYTSLQNWPNLNRPLFNKLVRKKE